MNAASIRKLRIKFIAIAMLSLFVAMAFISGMLNFANYQSSMSLVKQELERIVDNDGEINDSIGKMNEYLSQTPGFSNAFKPHYQRYQYYSCIFDEDGNITKTVNRMGNSIDTDEIEKYATKALDGGKDFGKYGTYFYQVGETSAHNTLVVLLDGTIEISTTTRLFYWSLAVCGVGLLITFVLVWIFSKKLIQPEIENSRRQKQFITNASHELKTPLAVIRANVEMEEIMNGATEFSKSTIKQIDHMNGLIQNLVLIAKAEEKEDKTHLSEENISNLVRESVEPFKAMAEQEHLKLAQDIEPDVKKVTDGDKIRQLTTILIDNAIKYCDDNGAINVRLSGGKKGKNIQLTVSNTYAQGATVDYNQFFDRFYREDSSHNIDRGGYGIGLSIAESICKQNSGSIKAEWKDGEIFFICKL